MKKMTLLYLSACLCLSVVISCKKDPSPESTASLTLIDALPGYKYILTDFPEKRTELFSGMSLLLYYGIYAPNCHLSVAAKEQSIAFYKYPFVANDQPIYQLKLKPASGEISTLFITGTLAKPEHFIVTATPPYHGVNDSIAGLRFVNLSAGSGPVNVKISGQGLNNVISSNNLAYKGSTAYLPVPATSKIGDLLVEFYDQASGNLLASYAMPGVGATLIENKWRYRNYTLALKGLPNASNPADAQGVMLIDDF